MTSKCKKEVQEKPGFCIKMPHSAVDVNNLNHLLEAKGTLIQKALGADRITVEEGEEIVSFPWFDEVPSAEEAEAYTKFIAAICEMSVKQKRIAATEKPTENEKFTFRCFLIRLGFNGDQFKQDRKILLKNLTGSSAFKNGTRKGDEQ